MFALIQQKTGERLGQPNYILYSMAGSEFDVGNFTGSGCNGSGASGVGTTNSLPASNRVFYDIQTGNTSVDCQGGKPDCYVVGGKTYGIFRQIHLRSCPRFPRMQDGTRLRASGRSTSRYFVERLDPEQYRKYSYADTGRSSAGGPTCDWSSERDRS
jgi:hypothetical protein